MKIAALLIMTLFIAGCVSQTYPQDISRGTISGIENERSLVIKNQEDFNSFWSELNPQNTETPLIDFSREYAIAVTLGQKPSTAYSIEIVNVTEIENQVIVHVKKTEPEPDVLVAPALTQPYHIIKILKTHKDIVFLDFK